MKIIYHSEDYDGICSAAIVYWYFKDPVPEIDLIPYNYGDDFDESILSENELVYVVDVSLDKLLMSHINSFCDLVWIDHHQTAIDELNELDIKGVQAVDSEKAACLLCWEYFYPNTNPTKAVKYISDYDICDHSDPATLQFQYGLRRRNPRNPSTRFWGQLLWKEEEGTLYQSRLLSNIRQDGMVILDYQKQVHEEIAKNAFVTTHEGFRYLCVNAYGGSKVLDSVFDLLKHDACCIFTVKSDKVKVGLYSYKQSPDVGRVAKKYGGGGRRTAAGFTVKTFDEFFKIFTPVSDEDLH